MTFEVFFGRVWKLGMAVIPWGENMAEMRSDPIVIYRPSSGRGDLTGIQTFRPER